MRRSVSSCLTSLLEDRDIVLDLRVQWVKRLRYLECTTYLLCREPRLEASNRLPLQHDGLNSGILCSIECAITQF
jgi:hypothetical protein